MVKVAYVSAAGVRLATEPDVVVGGDERRPRQKPVTAAAQHDFAAMTRVAETAAALTHDQDSIQVMAPVVAATRRGRQAGREGSGDPVDRTYDDDGTTDGKVATLVADQEQSSRAGGDRPGRGQHAGAGDGGVGPPRADSSSWDVTHF